MKRSALRRSAAPSARAKHLHPHDHASSMIAKLRQLYPFPEWAVRSSTGLPDVLRIADALAVNLVHPVDGIDVHGFELKTSRADWLAEFRDPLKSGPLKAFCSAWWLVVSCPWRNVLSLSELPDLWGCLEVGTGAPKIVRYAVERRAEDPTTHPGFIKSLLRSAVARGELAELGHDGVPRVRINRVIDRQHVGLLCGHVTLRPFAKEGLLPLYLPCFGCAEGRPIDHEYIESAYLALPEEDKARLRTLILGRKPGGAA